MTGDDREVVDLRIAECDYFLKRYAAARDGVQPYLDNASRKAEAKFFYASAIRGLGDADEATRLTTRAGRRVSRQQLGGRRAQQPRHALHRDERSDDLAAQTFKELYDEFPSGPYAERSAWKYGWRAYTTGNYAETARVFESAAAAFPRSDYRPPYLYWAGARARTTRAARTRRRHGCASSTPTT